MKNSKLMLPNHIVVKDGLACGDKITLLYDFEDEIMRFQFVGEGCSYCNETCRFLQQKFNLQNVEYIVNECEVLLFNLTDTLFFEKMLGMPYKRTRLECCFGPIRILRDCAKESSEKVLSETRINLYVDKMECDACAIRENVSWLYEKPSHEHGQFNVTPQRQEMLMKLGKLRGCNLDIQEVRQLYETLDEDAFLFMEEYKLYPMVYQNLLKSGILKNDDSRWRLLVYQRQRTVVAYKEYAEICNFIKDNKYKVFGVKGSFTHQFYENKMMRNLTDFDFLAIDENEAFKVIEWLLNKDFCIFPDSFSLKRIKQNGEYRYTGHLHFQKILNLQYRMIVDINFTGFPMLRVASYVPKCKDGQITLECMIVVTLCHLFKHKEVFMKDLNDIYLMLTKKELVVSNLFRELDENGLRDLFAIVVDYYIREFDVPKDEDIFWNIAEIILEEKKDYGNWPYDKNIVECVKKAEYEKYAQDTSETERIYLHPVLIFKSFADVNEIGQTLEESEVLNISRVEKLTDWIVQYEIENIYFILTPIGCFLEMKEYYTESMKTKICQILELFLIELKQEYMDIPYAIAYEEEWLDNREE